MSEFFGDVHAFHFTDEDFRILRHGYSCQLGNGVSLLPDNFGVKSAVNDNGFAHMFGLFLVEEVAAAVGELFFHRLIYLSMDDNRLLRGADHAVVKSFGMYDGADCQQQIRRFVNNRRSIARADSQSRFAAGVGRFDHARASGGENDVCFLHNSVCEVEGGDVNPSDDALRRTGFNGGVKHHFGCGDGGVFCLGVRADDDAVACLQSQEGLKDSC